MEEPIAGAPTIGFKELIVRISDLKVADDPSVHGDIACLMVLHFPDGMHARVGLTTEAFRFLVSALVENRIPSDKAVGRH